MQPLISICTPTHDPNYLGELYSSLAAQEYGHWEWIVCPNNGAKVNLPADERIRVVPVPFASASVGFLKKFTFLQAKGEYLVEADHDDLLTPNALTEIVSAFSDSDVGFVYSNCARIGSSEFDAAYGWQHRRFRFKTVDLVEPVSFEPDAASFSHIWYAPDHVRAWRASVYHSIGGHRESLSVLDDHDLLIRTYLHTQCEHIDKCLYIYRVTGHNTWLHNRDAIQSGTVELFRQHGYPLVEREAELRGLLKVDLGCGDICPPGYLGVDADCSKKPAICADLSKRWPMEDNSVGVLRACDAIEHWPDKIHTMSEAWRVLADGGWFMVEVPSTDGRGAFQDPTHVSYWNDNAFWYWTRSQAKYINNRGVFFQEFRLETTFPTLWHKDNNIPYTYAWLRAVKSDSRRPGQQLFRN